MGNTKKSHSYVDWQARGEEFSKGDMVTRFGDPQECSGRVTSSYPAIGMVDVQFPHGNVRLPVESLQLWSVSYVSGPLTDDSLGSSKEFFEPSVKRVANLYIQSFLEKHTFSVT